MEGSLTIQEPPIPAAGIVRLLVTPHDGGRLELHTPVSENRSRVLRATHLGETKPAFPVAMGFRPPE